MTHVPALPVLHGSATVNAWDEVSRLNLWREDAPDDAGYAEVFGRSMLRGHAATTCVEVTCPAALKT